MTVEDLTQWLQFTAALLIFTGFAVALMPVGSCDSCPHCRNQRVPTCPIHRCPRSMCERMHKE